MPELSKQDREVYFGAAAQDLIDFSIVTDKSYDPQWFHEAIAHELQRIERGEIKRLIIEMPPRHGKSELASVKFPAWLLGRHPDWPVLHTSYSDDLSVKHSGETREILGSTVFRAIFPNVEVSPDTSAKNFWQVGHRDAENKFVNDKGGYQAVGIGGAATGFGAKVVIIDDPLKNREEADSSLMRDKIWNWYTSVARTRLEDGGAIIIIMTRWHEDDLVGRVLATGQPWTVVSFPAIAEEDEPKRKKGEALWVKKYPLEALEELRKDTDDRAWFSLYQQQPRRSSSQSFDPDWFPSFRPEDVKAVCNRYAVLDVADRKRDGADWTGVSVVDWSVDDNWYLQYLKRYRVNIKELIDLIFWVWINFRPLAIGVEKKAFEDQIKPLLEDEAAKRGVYPVVVQLHDRGRNKESRILGALQGRAQHKRVHLREGATDDTEAFKTELWSFPRGRWDDLLDAVAYTEDIGQRPFAPSAEAIGRGRARKEDDVNFN